MIYVQTEDARRILRRMGAALDTRQMNIVISRSINKTLGQVRTQARREIKTVYNISQKDLSGVDYRRSTQATLTGKLVASRKPIPLDTFAPRQETGGEVRRISRRGQMQVRRLKRAKKKPVKGVSIEVFKGKRETVDFAFLIPGGAVRVFARGQYKSGGEYGFVRRFKRVNKDSDTPVKPLITVSLFGEILNRRVMGRIGAHTRVIYPGIMEHEVRYLLSSI